MHRLIICMGGIEVTTLCCQLKINSIQSVCTILGEIVTNLEVVESKEGARPRTLLALIVGWPPKWMGRPLERGWLANPGQPGELLAHARDVIGHAAVFQQKCRGFEFVKLHVDVQSRYCCLDLSSGTSLAMSDET